MRKKKLPALKMMCAVVMLFLAGAWQNMNAATINVQDSIFTNTHWTACNQYVLYGYVYVVNGVTLTIDPGTIIKGDKNTKGTLIIERGAKRSEESRVGKESRSR